MSDILFLSLVQDVNSLENLILKIYNLRTDNPFTINSWRQPTKCFLDTINFNVDEVQPTTLKYTTVLEILIDRLYVLLNQYLDYIMTPTAKCCASQGLSGRPQKISLGALNSNLWDRIEDICEFNKIYRTRSIAEAKFINDNKSNKNLELVNKHSQTENMPNSKCDSCFVAINCIKSIAQQMESILPNGFTEKNRKLIEPNIFELTQFGCMNSIITALLADVNVLVEGVTNAQNASREETAKNSRLKTKLEDSSKCNACLQIELSKMENQNEKLMGEIENYKAELYSKNESEMTYKGLLKTLPQELQIANDKTSSLQGELEALQYSDTILTTQIENLQKQQELVIVERDMWKQRCISSQKDNNTLKFQNDDLGKDVASLNDCVQRTEESNRSMNLLMEFNASKMDEKIKNNTNLLDKLQTVIEKKLLTQEQEIDKLKKTQSQTSVISNVSDQSKNKQQEKNQTIMKGDPIEDMAKQIEVNNMNMMKLKAQNETLLHTINKLRHIQTKKRLSIF